MRRREKRPASKRGRQLMEPLGSDRIPIPRVHSGGQLERNSMSTILIIVVVVLLVGGGGFYGRGRYW